MITKALQARKLNLKNPSETREFGHGRLEIANIENYSVARVSLKPGWDWEKDLRPLAHTDTCQSEHVQYVLQGRLAVKMDDGSELELGPGDAAFIPPGHTAHVVGDEEFVAIDFTGLKDYAKMLPPKE